MNRIRTLRVHAAMVALLSWTVGSAVFAQGDVRVLLGIGVYSLTESGAGARSFDPLVRLEAGVGLTFPLRYGLSARPEMRYLTRGAAFDGTVEDLAVDMELELTTLDLGLMAGWDLPVSSSVQPRVFAGPVLGWVAESTLLYRPVTGGTWFSQPYSEMVRMDLSVAGGAEIVFPVAGTRAIVGARGLLGLTDIVKEGPTGAERPEWRHRGFDVYVALGL